MTDDREPHGMSAGSATIELSEAARCVNTERPLAHQIDSTDWQDAMNATCSVDGCGRPLFRNEICEPHYNRLRKTGSLGGPDFRVQTHGETPCKADGCDSIAKARGWCSAHYLRWKNHGDPNVGGPVKHPGQSNPCTVDDCDRRARIRGHCQMHWRRVQKHGDPHIIGPQQPPPFMPVGPTNPLWKGADVGYMAVHSRLTKYRGPAKNHPCGHCDRQALHWAYDHCDSDVRMSPEGRPYSVDLDHYFPLCARCHARFDLDQEGK